MKAPPKAENIESEKILVIRLSSIGDIVQCSAIPRHLRQKFSSAQIHWVVRSDNADLLKCNPHINELIVFDRESGFRGWRTLSQTLASAGYTRVYDAHNNLRSFLLRFYLRFYRPSGAPKPKIIVRSKSRFKRWLLFWYKINLFPPGSSAVASYVEPLEKWQIRYDGKGGELHVDPATTAKVKNLLGEFAERHFGKSAGDQRRWLAIAPATAWPKKNWPLPHWKSLVAELLKSTDYAIAVLGGPADSFCGELILDPHRVLNLQGKLKLLESAAVAPLCVTLIAADTGLLHMAEAMNSDVVGLLGPTPFGNPSRVGSVGLQKKLWCRPCSKDGSGPCVNFTYQKCMKLIMPAEVLKAANRVVDQRTERR